MDGLDCGDFGACFLVVLDGAKRTYDGDTKLDCDFKTLLLFGYLRDNMMRIKELGRNKIGRYSRLNGI